MFVVEWQKFLKQKKEKVQRTFQAVELWSAESDELSMVVMNLACLKLVWQHSVCLHQRGLCLSYATIWNANWSKFLTNVRFCFAAVYYYPHRKRKTEKYYKIDMYLDKNKTKRSFGLSFWGKSEQQRISEKYKYLFGRHFYPNQLLIEMSIDEH